MRRTICLILWHNKIQQSTALSNIINPARFCDLNCSQYFIRALQRMDIRLKYLVSVFLLRNHLNTYQTCKHIIAVKYNCSKFCDARWKEKKRKKKKKKRNKCTLELKHSCSYTCTRYHNLRDVLRVTCLLSKRIIKWKVSHKYTLIQLND